MFLRLRLVSSQLQIAERPVPSYRPMIWHACSIEADGKINYFMEYEMSAFDTQEGGNHYKEFLIQPVEFIHKNGIPFIEGNIIKYVTRHRSKNGIEDLKKARHYIDLLIEMESQQQPA